MEQCFRIALWMVLLIGYLHARSIVDPLDLNQFNWTGLRASTCNENVKFSSPTNVTGNCYIEALAKYREELDRATNECEDAANGLIYEAWDLINRRLPKNISENCNFTMTVHEQFASFVDNTKGFLPEFNSHAR